MRILQHLFASMKVIFIDGVASPLSLENEQMDLAFGQMIATIVGRVIGRSTPTDSPPHSFRITPYGQVALSYHRAIRVSAMTERDQEAKSRYPSSLARHIF